MRRLVRLNCLLVVLGLFTTIKTLGQTPIDKLHNYFEKLHQTGQFNGNVLIAENGKIVFQKSFGYADHSIRKINSSQTSFPVASITKTFTSTAILQLQERGKLNISDPYVK